MAQQAGGQIQAVIQRERERERVPVSWRPAWGISAGDLRAGPSSVGLRSKLGVEWGGGGRETRNRNKQG